MSTKLRPLWPEVYLERDGQMLRLYDPATGKWLPSPREQLGLERKARLEAEAEVERLRHELEVLRRGQKS